MSIIVTAEVGGLMTILLYMKLCDYSRDGITKNILVAVGLNMYL